MLTNRIKTTSESKRGVGRLMIIIIIIMVIVWVGKFELFLYHASSEIFQRLAKQLANIF